MGESYTNMTAVILAGGRGRRLGYPKALLRIGGRPVIELILKALGIFFDEILIVTDRREYFPGLKGVEVVEDLVPGCGPMGGIYTGLKLGATRQAFFVGCDMPFIQAGLVNRILSRAGPGDCDCVVPYREKGLEPLHAVYSSDCLPVLADALAKNEFALCRLVGRLRTAYFLAEPGETLSFFNINTPQDLDRLGRRRQPLAVIPPGGIMERTTRCRPYRPPPDPRRHLSIRQNTSPIAIGVDEWPCWLRMSPARNRG